MIKNLDDLLGNWNGEEHFLLTDVYSQGELIAQQVRTKLVMDNCNPRNSVCYLYPSKEIYKSINIFEYEIKGIFKDMKGGNRGTLHISKAYHGGGRQKYLANSWDENSVKIHPKEILIKWFVGEETKETKSEAIFILTGNKAINPTSYIMIEPDCIKKRRVGPRIKLSLKNGDYLVFDECLNSKSVAFGQKNGYFSSFVPTMKLIRKNSNNSYPIDEQILQNIEYLLWYLSFATGQRITWMQWSARSGTEFLQYARCNITYPHIDLGKGNAIIENGLIKEFLQKCSNYLYASNKNKVNLYLPIVYFVNSKEKTCEFKFLSLFMSLEALLNLFAKNNNMACLFDRTEWNTLYKYMSNSIKEFRPMGKKKKELLIPKLGNLNEVSLKSIFEKFCKSHNVNLSDLWPIFDNKIKLSLSRIRNKLVHGEELDKFNNLDVATEHLRWIVGRCILAQLKWRKSSGVDNKSLDKIAYYNWREFVEESKS